jgi:hypothetical protein
MRRSRVLGWDRNPVRRRIDRIEAGLLAGLFAVLLIGAPVLAGMAGRGIRAAGLRQQRAEASWRPEWAIVQRGVAPGDLPWAAGTVRRGSLTDPPLRRAQLRERISTARVLTAGGVAVLLVFVAGAGRHLLGQRRLTGWEREWRAVEPRWTKSRY